MMGTNKISLFYSTLPFGPSLLILVESTESQQKNQKDTEEHTKLKQ